MFDIDRYLDPFIPSNRLDRLPWWISRWFGYRSPDDQSVTDTLTPLLRCKYGYFLTNLIILLNTFAAVIIVTCVCKFSKTLNASNLAAFMPPWAAACILFFNASRAPLIQPRNTIFGTFFASLVGVIISKLFRLSTTGADNYWVGAAISVAISSIVMLMTKTVHPPAGAITTLPFYEQSVRDMGFYFIAVELAISCIFIGLAMLFNNFLLVYPMYFWTPALLNRPKKTGEYDIERNDDQESNVLPDKTFNCSTQVNEPGYTNQSQGDNFPSTNLPLTPLENPSPAKATAGNYLKTAFTRTTDPRHTSDQRLQITITPSSVSLPSLLQLNELQKELIEQLQFSLDTINVVSPENSGFEI